MQGSVYAAGSAGCERYDLQQEIWVDCQHKLPTTFILGRSSVVVSEDESFAVITGVVNDYDEFGQTFMFIFTEDFGFKMLNVSNRGPMYSQCIKLSVQIE